MRCIEVTADVATVRHPKERCGERGFVRVVKRTVLRLSVMSGKHFSFVQGTATPDLWLGVETKT